MEINKRPHPHQPISVIKRQTNKVGNYILGNTIGQGGFAKVKLATHIYTQQKVAIKILDKSKIIQEPSDLVRIKKEINIFKLLRHKNVIQLYEIMESTSALYIVMEYCEGKELFDYIIKRKQLTEREACRFFQQIINGVEYLHLSNITHRDLKPENLLLDHKRRIKISDFGLSTYSYERDNGLLETPCGTPSYAPPEMLRGDEYKGLYSDIWSCGIILYTMLCGNLPYAESKEELIYEYLITQKIHYPRYLSVMAIDLLNELLAINPTDRPDFNAIKRHPWFNMIKPQLKPGVVMGVHKIPIDENILNKIEQYGYDKEKCRQSIEGNYFDCFSCIYYLILKEFSRDGKNSISDLYSDCYVDYFKDLNHWINPGDISKEKYKEYWIEKKPNASQCLGKRVEGGIINVNSRNHNRTVSPTTPIKKVLISPGEINNLHLKLNLMTIQSHFPKRKKKEAIKVEEEYITGTEILSDEIIKKKLAKLQGDNEKFIKSMKDIDRLGKSDGNSVLSISDKLIKGTIFGKYLIKHLQQKNAGCNASIGAITDLESKFLLMQKYKCLMEFIEMTYPGMFHRKIYDCSCSAFDSFLKEEEDFVFGRDYLKNNLNIGFLDKIKQGIRIIHKRVNSVQNSFLSKTHNQYEFMLSADSKFYSKTKNKPRKNFLVFQSSYVKEDQVSEIPNSSSSSSSSSSSLLVNGKYNSNNTVTNARIQKTVKMQGVKSAKNCNKNNMTIIPKIAMSMNMKMIMPNKDKQWKVLSEGIAMTTARTTIKKTSYIKENTKKTTVTPKKHKIISIYPVKKKKLNPYAKVPIQTFSNNTNKKKPKRAGRSVEIEDMILNNDIQKKMLSHYNDISSNKRNYSSINYDENNLKTLHPTIDTIDNNDIFFKSPIQPFNSVQYNIQQYDYNDTTKKPEICNTFQSFNEDLCSNEETESLNDNDNHANEMSSLPIYSGLVDFQCCIELPPSQIMIKIKKALRNKNYNCKESNNKISCSKGYNLLQITLLKLIDTSLIVYLKIQHVKGDKTFFQEVIKIFMKALAK